MKVTVKKLLSYPKYSGGFTLIEMMMALAIAGVLMGSVYSAYLAQQRTYLAQDQVAEMQQNIRAAMYMISRDLRMAGYDLTGTANAGISIALAGRVSFTQDITDDTGTGPPDGDLSDTGEVIDFGFSLAIDPGRDGIPDADTDGDGVPDTASLGKQTGGAGGYHTIAENIQAIEFNYLDKDFNVTSNTDNIRSIQISILARADKPDRKFINNTEYTPASEIVWDLNGAATGNAPNDNYRRRLLTTTIQCRNMGI